MLKELSFHKERKNYYENKIQNNLNKKFKKEHDINISESIVDEILFEYAPEFDDRSFDY